MLSNAQVQNVHINNQKVEKREQSAQNKREGEQKRTRQSVQCTHNFTNVYNLQRKCTTFSKYWEDNT